MGFDSFAAALTADMITQGIAFATDFRTVIGVVAGLGIMALSFGIIKSVLS